jgi:hypothetical protein
MKPITAFFLLNIIVPLTKLAAQSDTIFYSAPKEVRQLMINHIAKYQRDSIAFYGAWKSSGDSVGIMLVPYTPRRNDWSLFLKTSNRYLRLNPYGLILPLILESDLQHSEAYFKIRNMDKPNEIHRRAYHSASGYAIHYIRGSTTKIIFIGREDH